MILTLAKGIAMLSFKQQIVLVLLQNLDWMPKFESIESAAEYLCEDVPETIHETIAIQQKAIALLIAETADHIMATTGGK